MDIVINILLIILLLAAIFLCLFLIDFLKKSAAAVDKLQKDVHQIHLKVEPVLSNLNMISDNVANITNTIDNQVTSVGNMIDQVKEKVEGLLNFEKKIKESVDNSPVADLYRKLTGVSKGVSAFWNIYKRK